MAKMCKCQPRNGGIELGSGPGVTTVLTYKSSYCKIAATYQ